MRSLAVLLLLALPADLAAQSTPTLTAPVDHLAWMVGEWEGPATYRRGPETIAVRQTERVEIQSGGTILAVRGRGFVKLSDGTEPVRFEAFAVVYKQRDGTLALRAHSMEGLYIDPTVATTDSGLIWSFEDPRIGRIRYTTTHTAADEWHEIGEWSRDGATWTQFVEMTLKRR